MRLHCVHIERALACVHIKRADIARLLPCRPSTAAFASVGPAVVRLLPFLLPLQSLISSTTWPFTGRTLGREEN